MSPTPDGTLDDLQLTIADLKRQLAESNAERDEARRRLAESTTERDEALEQQTATAEVLQVINSSPGDLAPVFDAMLERAMRLCEAEIGTLWISDGERSHAVASRGAPPAYAEFLKRGPHPRPTRTRGIVHIPDVRETEFYRDGNPLVRAGADLGGVRTMLAVPLRKDEVVLGRFSIYRQEVRPFTEKQISLLQNFAAQAVIAMENARLITETHEALEQQTATAEVLGVINSSPGNLGPVFEAMLRKAVHLCGAAFGLLRGFDGECFPTLAVHGVSDAEAEPFYETLAADPGSVLEQIQCGEPVVHIADVMDTEAYRSGVATRQRLVDVTGARTALWVALRKDNSLLGVFVIYRQEVRPFTDKQIALLQNFAAQAVIAMENARLITETREALEQQTATAEVLGVINSSPGDLAPVFDAILEKAHTLCGAAIGALLTFDGESFGFLARKVPADLAEIASRPFKPSPQNRLNDLIRGEPLLHIPDAREVLALAPEDPQLHATIELGGMRTYLAVPLRKDDRLIGAITAARQEVRPFTEKQIALLQNFAAQAVIAMENARLITETREALEQQTATAEVLQVINSSPGDLAPVFDAMLEKATRLCEAPFGVLRSWDGECFHVCAVHGEPRFSDWVRQRGPTRPEGDDPLARIARGAGVVHFADPSDDPAYVTSAAFKDAVELSGMRSGITVPLRKDDALLGAITIYRQEVRPFSDKQIALLQNFAAQAVIAMENARLLTETSEALERQTATAEVLQVINSSPGNLTPVFDAILEKAHTFCGADHGTLTVADGEYFRAIAMRGIPEGFAEVIRRPFVPTHEFHERLLGGERFIHIADLTEAQVSPESPFHRAAGDLGGVRSVLVVPLRRHGAILGVITAFRQEVRPFSDRQIALLENFGAQAAIAMENARLLTETREALEQQTATAEVLQAINSSPGDLLPVLDAVVEKAMRLCEATNGFLFTYDGDRFHAAAIHGDPRLVEWHRQLGPFRPAANTGLERLRRGERLVHIPDVGDVDVFRSVSEPRQAAEISGVRSALTVALRRDEVLLGALGLYRREVRPFSDKQIALLQNFAAQAVIAMENARLIGELRERTDQVAELNRGLEARVAEQVEELGRIGRLKRFLAPQLAELIVSQGDEKILESHRREIVVVFCDLRGYTAFTETAEPEEVLEFLREYHGALGPLVAQFEGTLDQFSGDGIMVFFNDPVPCPDPAERAVNMAVAMREAAGKLIAAWRRHGCDLGFGAGIAQGYATLGQIGFFERSGYTAIGTVCNLAARLCAEAKDGQILVSSRIAEAIEAVARLEDLGNLELKGLRRPVAAFNVVQSTSAAGAYPNLTVVPRGSGA